MGSSEEDMAAVIDELTKGWQSAKALTNLLLIDPPEQLRAGLLLEGIMSAISKAISALESGLKQQASMKPQVLSPSFDVTSKASADKGRNQRTRTTGNRKRGAWTRVTSRTIDDGYIWRKYGQKDIFSAKYPRCSTRSYFRCTYKFGRGCKATRQVQKSEEDPLLYVITYFGEHSCKEEAKENLSRSREPCVISFESNKFSGVSNPGIPFSSLPSNKQEIEEEVMSNLTSGDSLSDCLEPPEMELQKPSSMSESLIGLNSSVASCDLEFMDIENFLSFDPIELFTWQANEDASVAVTGIKRDC